MDVRQGFAGCEVLAAAKLNLLLEVLGRRDDGYHEIETLMVPINLFDSILVEADLSAPHGELRLDCRWAAGLLKCDYSANSAASRSACTHVESGNVCSVRPRHAERAYYVAGTLRVPSAPRYAPFAARSSRPPASEWEDLPQGSENIVIRALEALRNCAGVKFGATVRLTKRIPSAAGLGGGSSDAAAALIAANRVWRLAMSEQQLQHIAADVGSDVPFFLGSGAAKCVGRGEQVEPLAGIPSIDFVVVAPPGGLSTAEVYRAGEPAKSPRSVDHLTTALRRKDLRGIAEAMHNQLEPAAERLSPWIVRAKQELAECGCAAVQMSGSGSSCFGICRDAQQARRAARWMRSRGWNRSMAVRSIRSTH